MNWSSFGARADGWRVGIIPILQIHEESQESKWHSQVGDLICAVSTRATISLRLLILFMDLDDRDDAHSPAACYLSGPVIYRLLRLERSGSLPQHKIIDSKFLFFDVDIST